MLKSTGLERDKRSILSLDGWQMLLTSYQASLVYCLHGNINAFNGTPHEIKIKETSKNFNQLSSLN